MPRPLIISALWLAGLGWLCSTAQAADFDPVPTILSAPEIVDAELLKGDHHQLITEVENDGYMNRYRIASDFGRFEAYGTAVLAIRVLEVGALAQLDELSKSEVFAEAAKKSALSSVDTLEQFAEKPVETVKGIPRGAKRLFRVTKRQATELVEEVEEKIDEHREESAEGDDGEGGEGKGAGEMADEAVDAGASLIKRHLGITAAERRWAQKLGVDPYTSNEVLRKEIKKVARVDSAGRFGAKLLPIPSIPGVSVIRTVNSVVWSKDPYELQDFNRGRLLSIGVPEAQVDAFFEVPWMSPSAQTLFVTALVDLEDAEDRPVAIEHALELESLDEGRFLLQAARMLAWIDEKHVPIARLLRGERTLVAVTGDRRQVVPLPVDHLLWTPELEALAERRSSALNEVGAEGRELWLLETVSELCRSRLEALGWKLETEVGSRMRADPISPGEQAPSS